MNTTHNNIEEQRLAMLEMRTILNHVQSIHGANPPADILIAIAELAKANRAKSTTNYRHLNYTAGIEEFCMKNNLSLAK